jgi:hypothetical protein
LFEYYWIEERRYRELFQAPVFADAECLVSILARRPKTIAYQWADVWEAALGQRGMSSFA